MIDGSILDRQNLYLLIDLMAADLNAGHSWGDSGSNDAMKLHDKFEEARFDETAKDRDPQTDALRDQFAMAALQGLLAYGGHSSIVDTVSLACEYGETAAAMLAARKKGEKS